MTIEEMILALGTALCILSVIINVCVMIKIGNIEADIILESAGLDEKKNLVMPVAEVKAEFSEEDMKKIKELLNNAKQGSVKLGESEEKNVTCDHLYNSIVLIDDPINCREKLVFHCEHCCHEEIMPIERGLMTKFFMGGGKT